MIIWWLRVEAGLLAARLAGAAAVVVASAPALVWLSQAARTTPLRSVVAARRVLVMTPRMVLKARIPYSQRSHLQAVAMGPVARLLQMVALVVLAGVGAMLALVDRGTHHLLQRPKDRMEATL